MQQYQTQNTLGPHSLAPAARRAHIYIHKYMHTYIHTCIYIHTGAGHGNASTVALFTSASRLSKIAPCVPPVCALRELFATLALPHRHGVHVVFNLGFCAFALWEAEQLAKGCSAMVGVPEIVSADRVIFSFEQNLRHKGLARLHGFTTLRPRKLSVRFREEACSTGILSISILCINLNKTSRQFQPENQALFLV